MPPTIQTAFAGGAHTAVAMCVAGAATGLIAAVTSRREIADARGADRINSLAHLCIAVPLAAFGALHLFGPQFVSAIVPRYMPWRPFWVDFVGCALIAAALSIATRIAVRWSGLMVGIMMFAFVAMIHLPGALRTPDDPFRWVIVFRELSFGGGGWLLAGTAVYGWSPRIAQRLVGVGRAFVTLAMLYFAVGHFLRPLGLPGVPLAKLMPSWIPARPLVDYVTGAVLLGAGASVVLSRRTRMLTTMAGGWLLLTVLLIYTPVLIGAFGDPALGVQVVGVNYFADTLLFAGAILSLARAEYP
jgi:uncharacterized membrane protein